MATATITQADIDNAIPRCQAFSADEAGWVDQCDNVGAVALRDGRFLCPLDAAAHADHHVFDEATGTYREAA